MQRPVGINEGDDGSHGDRCQGGNDNVRPKNGGNRQRLEQLLSKKKWHRRWQPEQKWPKGKLAFDSAHIEESIGGGGNDRDDMTEMEFR